MFVLSSWLDVEAELLESRLSRLNQILEVSHGGSIELDIQAVRRGGSIGGPSRAMPNLEL